MPSKKTDSAALFFGEDTDDSDEDLNLDVSPTEEAAAAIEGEIAIDVYQTNSHVVIVSPIAGVDPKDIEISAADDEVTISCERTAEHATKGDNITTQEIYWGKCTRTVELPVPCLVDRASASYKHGILTVKVPKAQKARKKTIKVTAAL